MSVWSRGFHFINVVFRRLFINALLVSVLSTFIFTSRSFATVYSWTKNTQIVLVKDSWVTFSLMIEAIKRAQRSIEGVTYIQSIDPYMGLQVLDALRSAHMRGVKGKYIYESTVSWPHHLLEKLTGFPAAVGFNPNDLLRQSLHDGQVEVNDQNPVGKLSAGLGLVDMVHKKMLIIDRGTPNEVIFVLEKNNDRFATFYLDRAIILRRLDFSQPWIGDQIEQDYDKTWQLLSSVNTPKQSKSAKAHELRPIPKIPLLTTPLQFSQFDTIDKFLAEPPDPSTPMTSFESRPNRLRLVTNDVLEYGLTGRYGLQMVRKGLLTSDIVETTASELAKAREAHFTMLAVFMPAQLLDAAKAMLRNGGELHLYTCSRESFKVMVPFGLGYDLSLEQIAELTALGGNFHVHVMNLKHLDEVSLVLREPSFLHSKSLVLRYRTGESRFSSIGSDNFNTSSLRYNDEIVVQIDDKRFADQLRASIAEDESKFENLDCEQIFVETNVNVSLGTKFKRASKRLLNGPLKVLY